MQREWYALLPANGFTDIENRNGDLIDHKTTLDFISRKDAHTAIQFEAKQSYYQWARTKLNDGKFRSDRDKFIWECHTEGLSTREISPIVGLQQSWLVRKINKIKSHLTTQLDAIGSMSYAIA